MEIILIIFKILIIAFSMFIAVEDVLKRKIKNKYLLIFSILAVIFFIINLPTSLINILLILIIVVISFLLHNYSIWGAADGKYFIISSIIILSFGSYISILEYLFNLLIFFTIGSLIIGIIITKYRVKLSIIKHINYKMLLFQSIIIVALSSTFYKYFQYLGFDIQTVSILTLISIILFATLSTIIYKLSNKNEIIIYGFISFSIGFYNLNYLYPISLIILYLIKIVISYATEISNQGMHDKKNGFAPPIVTYMVFALIFQIIINKNLVSLIFDILA